MIVLHYDNVEAKIAEEGASGLRVRWLITKDIGAKNFAMRMFEMESGGHSPYHSHSWEHEVFILDGTGIVLGEKEEITFRPQDVIFIPPNEKHQFRNNGKKIVRFLCLIPYLEQE